ncbi:MAG: N-glycosylase/DNA lyase [Candidatus Diapherotrites archaeon]
MKKLLLCVNALKKGSEGKLVCARMDEFSGLGKKESKELFNELCFCLLTANFNAERAIKIQEALGDGFFSLSEKKLAKKLKQLGYRYPNTRAKYISEARKHAASLKDTIKSFSSEAEARHWLAENVKGLGYKEASHFLRNIGFKNLAIIDFHIADILAEHGLIEKPKSKALSRKQYLEIEKVLEKVAAKAGMNLAELDLYLWCAETGKILK